MDENVKIYEHASCKNAALWIKPLFRKCRAILPAQLQRDPKHMWIYILRTMRDGTWWYDYESMQLQEIDPLIQG